MTISTYATLQTAISNWLKRDDLATNIPDFIQLYEAQMNRELGNMNPPHFSLLQVQEDSFANDGSAPFLIALPTGYKGTRRFQILEGGNYRTLTYKTPAEMAKYQVGGRPNYFTITGTHLEVACTPDNDYEYRWEYYTPLASVSAGSNWMIANAPDMYLYGSLMHSAPFLKNDDRLMTWGQLYAKALNDLELANSRYHYSGSTLQQRSDSAL